MPDLTVSQCWSLRAGVMCMFFPLSSSNQSRRNVLNSLQFIMLNLREAVKYTVAVIQA